MTMKLYISPNYSEIDEYITISKSGFFFSAEFVDKNQLKDNEFCQFFTSNDCDYKFGVSFSKEKKEGSFAIINTLRGKYKDKSCVAWVISGEKIENNKLIWEGESVYIGDNTGEDE